MAGCRGEREAEESSAISDADRLLRTPKRPAASGGRGARTARADLAPNGRIRRVERKPRHVGAALRPSRAAKQPPTHGAVRRRRATLLTEMRLNKHGPRPCVRDDHPMLFWNAA